MNNIKNTDSVDSYISGLLATPLDVSPIDELDDDTAAERYEMIVDDLYQECSDKSQSSGSSARVYLSFGIGSIKYIVPSTRVITVKRHCTDESSSDALMFDVSTLLAGQLKEVRDSRFRVVLQGNVGYSLLVDSINGVVSIRDHEMVYRKVTNNRPWYQGVSVDREYLLLDTYALGDALGVCGESNIMA